MMLDEDKIKNYFKDIDYSKYYEEYDVIVIGAGHAGCEAALSSARLGKKTLCLTLTIESIAFMPCNPNIGGTSKGHLVREIDALGGEMGKNIDKSFIQSKILNASRGPAVHSLRAQADKGLYSEKMKEVMFNTENLFIRQAEVIDLIVENNEVKGVITTSGRKYFSKAVIITTGTYLKSNCIYGDVSTASGPNGLKRAEFLSDSLKKYGIKLQRFKTGTPARVLKQSIDFSKCEVQYGDEKIVPFSFSNKAKDLKNYNIPCYLTYTNLETHNIIKDNIMRSPLYSGVIEGIGARYCPSIEDKVVKFAERERHQVFIEPEGLNSNEMYLSGLSSSLPEDVQFFFYRTIKGLENVQIVRNAYAIEYDCLCAYQLKNTLEFKNIKGLFSAGQMNGSSGYEEAAAQGLIAGINAVLMIDNKEPLILDRSNAYIGVLIDDLVTKEITEPYRMMTSRAEYRLLLRQDNADFRLTKIGYDIGLVDKEMYNKYLLKYLHIDEEIARIKNVILKPNDDINKLLEENNSNKLHSSISIYDLLARPELTYEKLAKFDPDRKELEEDEIFEINVLIKYEGYIERQKKQANQFKKHEGMILPTDLDYKNVPSLRLEAIEKLNKFKPYSIGQASRIAGVSPADINVLLIYLEKLKRENN